MVYKDAKDYDYFKRWMGKVCGKAGWKAGWKVHAWTLMPNHYHLLIEIRRKTLIKGSRNPCHDVFCPEEELTGDGVAQRHAVTLDC